MIRTLVLLGVSAGLTAVIVFWGIIPIATISGQLPDRRLLEEAAARTLRERERAQQAFDAQYAEMESFTDKVEYEWAQRRSHWLAVEQLKADVFKARRDHEAVLEQLEPLRARARGVGLIAGLVLWPLCLLVLARNLRRWMPPRPSAPGVP